MARKAEAALPIQDLVGEKYAKQRKIESQHKVNESSEKCPDRTANLVQTSTEKNQASDDDRSIMNSTLAWERLRGDNLNCDYCMLYSRTEATALMTRCEHTLQYNTDQLSRVRVFGKWQDIPRKQVAHGEEGLSYTFSGHTVAAKPWIPLLSDVRDKIAEVTGQQYNFVLINRYKDGDDYIGEHRDDETDLDPTAPIASLSLGQARDFIFKHADARGKNATRDIQPVTVKLEHGMLLLMNPPTNKYWYHSLPKRKKCHGVRINMTFRRMVPKKIH